MIDGEPTHLLGRHVADRAEHDTRLRRRGHRGHRARRPERRLILGELCETEVENLDLVIPGDEHVLGFQIAMRDPLVVRRREAVRDVKRQLNRLADRHRARVQTFPKRLAFEQLRHDEGRIGIRADVEHGEDVRVIQRRRGAGFLLESMKAIDAAGKCAGQYFDRDVTPEAPIACTVHLAHAACADGGHDLVRPEASARLQRQWDDGRL